MRKAGSAQAFFEWCGALAQLGERLHGMQEVSGSIPLGSTNRKKKAFTLADEVSSAGVFRLMDFCPSGLWFAR